MRNVVTFKQSYNRPNLSYVPLLASVASVPGALTRRLPPLLWSAGTPSYPRKTPSQRSPKSSKSTSASQVCVAAVQRAALKWSACGVVHKHGREPACRDCVLLVAERLRDHVRETERGTIVESAPPPSHARVWIFLCRLPCLDGDV